MAEARYRIGTVARLAGLTTHVIRVWERRYGAPAPIRSARGTRLYSDRDVERLRLLKRAVDRGHAIGRIAALPSDELARLTQSPRAVPANADACEAFGAELVAAVGSFDLAHASRALATASATLSPRALVIDVFGAALKSVGDAWARGQLCVASEHIASALLRNHLGALLRDSVPRAGAETVVAATPAGEQHELGVLLAAALAAIHGYRVVYLGPNVPAGEIVGAVRGAGAEILLLSLVALEKRGALKELRALTRNLPAHVTLLVGGRAAAPVIEALAGAVVAPDSLAAFERWLLLRGQRPEPVGAASR